MQRYVVKSIGSEGFEVVGVGYVYRAKNIEDLVEAIYLLRKSKIFNGLIYTGIPIEDIEMRVRQQALSSEQHKEFWRLYHSYFLN